VALFPPLVVWFLVGVVLVLALVEVLVEILVTMIGLCGRASVDAVVSSDFGRLIGFRRLWQYVCCLEVMEGSILVLHLYRNVVDILDC
jgi:hypothetical protein